MRASALLALVPALATAAPAPDPAPALHRIEQKWTGDLDGMVGRRLIRALVVYSKTFYFIDRGAPHGTSYDTLTAFETFLNARLKRRHLRVHVVFIPVSRDQLLPALIDGRGDIAAANLTITPAREKLVDFSHPFWRGISEVLVTGPGAPEMRGIEDLSGRKILVRASSSYYEHLVRLNLELTMKGKPPVVLELAPEHLEDEDLLEMVNAGLIPYVVVDSHKAKFWAKIFKRIEVHEDIAVNRGGEIAWAFRHESPELKAAVNQFVKRARKGTLFGNATFTKYLERFEVAFAAYNAGPTRIASLRRIAARRGLDPNLWFGSVERLAAEKIGRETVQYVSNIYKYYVAYRLARDERELRERAREKLRERY